MPEAYERLAADSPGPLHVVDLSGAVPAEWLHLMGLAESGSAVVVRPDTHIAGTARDAGPELSSTVEAALAGIV